MQLSLVVPAYKKEKVIATQLTRVYEYLTKRGLDFEILVVVDGLIDNTPTVVKTLRKEKGFDRIKLFVNKQNKGKGYVLRYGMKRAKGDIIGFIDADTDIKIKSLETSLNRMLEGDADIVIPTKFHSESEIKVDFIRKIFTYGLLVYTHVILNIPPNIKDPLCGLKLFKRDVIMNILPNLTINRFAVDIDILHWARIFGYKIAIVPFFIKIDQSGSTISNLREISMVMRDVWVIWSSSLQMRAMKLVGLQEAYLAKKR